MGHNKAKVNTSLLFVLLQTLLYVLFLLLDLTDSNITLSNIIKFSIIILCFCYALVFGRGMDRSIIFYLNTALLFTVVSDLLILILDYYFYGVLTFIIVQQLYGIYLITVSNATGTVKYGRLLRRFMFQLGLTTIICLILSQLGISLEGLLIASAFYFICIFTNTVSAVSLALRNPHKKGTVLFAVGIALFLLCDINVGLFNISGFVVMPAEIYEKIYSVSSILMWTFYAPAQVLIALSTSIHNPMKSANLPKK